jgi:CRP/FNR family transcriptional regulator, cyclic AMP receptor protein
MITMPYPGSFLARLQEGDQDFLLGDYTPRTFPANAVLFHQGDPSDSVVFLLSGWAKVFTDSLNEHEALLALRGPGDVLGELAAIDGRPRSATVQMLMPAQVAVLSANRLLSRLRQRPDIAIALLGDVADTR